MFRGQKTKRICLLLLFSLLAAAFSGCGREKEVYVFHAQIMEIRDRTMLVRPAEGSKERKSADAFLVDMASMNPSPEPGEGDWVEITYEGGITETYPAGLDHVISIVIVDAGVMDETESGPEEDEEGPDQREEEWKRVSVTGFPGEISAEIPEGWKAETYSEGQEGLTYGLYGLSLEPEESVSGRIELVAADSFGVCGTGLKTEEISLAGGRAVMGTYDDHKHWDYIAFGDGGPAAPAQVIAINVDCSLWEERHWEEAMSILDTVTFDLSPVEAGSDREENQKEE